MSIYGTWLHFSEDDHADGCAVYTEVEPGLFEFSGEPCDCGTPDAPIVYEGSHVLPSDRDRRGGYLDVAAIPSHIERSGRSDGREGVLKDWLRLSMANPPSSLMHDDKPYVSAGDAALVLDRRQVQELRDTLAAWLERDE